MVHWYVFGFLDWFVDDFWWVVDYWCIECDGCCGFGDVDCWWFVRIGVKLKNSVFIYDVQNGFVAYCLGKNFGGGCFYYVVYGGCGAVYCYWLFLFFFVGFGRVRMGDGSSGVGSGVVDVRMVCDGSYFLMGGVLVQVPGCGVYLFVKYWCSGDRVFCFCGVDFERSVVHCVFCSNCVRRFDVMGEVLGVACFNGSVE